MELCDTFINRIHKNSGIYGKCIPEDVILLKHALSEYAHISTNFKCTVHTCSGVSKRNAGILSILFGRIPEESDPSA